MSNMNNVWIYITLILLLIGCIGSLHFSYLIYNNIIIFADIVVQSK
jgi:hypothetical protein